MALQALQLHSPSATRTTGDLPALSSVSNSQREFFSAMLDSGTQNNVDVAQVTEHVLPVDSSSTLRGTSLGDSILRGLEKVRSGLNANWTSAASLLDPHEGPTSTLRVLQFQASMLNVGFQYQMVGGVVTKTAQNIDQLVKMQ